MKAIYTLNELSLRHGASMHYDYRSPILRWVRPLLGVALILFALTYLTQEPLYLKLIGIAMAFVGLLALFRKVLWVRRCARNALRGQQTDNGGISCSITADEEGIEVEAAKTKSTAPWEAFVDLRITPAGILLYPQRGLFIWIPRDAEIEDSTWDGLCELLSAKVQKRV